MNTHTFGKTGFRVASLGYGAAPAAFLNSDQQQLRRLLDRLLDAGVNVIDTAASYPGSEEALGQLLAPRRQQCIYVSKCGTKVQDDDAPEWSPRLIANTIDRALSRLRTDRLEVMLLHSCDLATLKKGDALAALVKARDAGKVRFVGYSGDNEAAAYAASQPDVAVIETSINIVDQRNIDGVLPACAKNNIGVLAKRPIANAAWKQIDQQPGMYKSYAKNYTERFAQMKLSPPADLGFSGNPADAWPEIALRFTLSQPGVHVAIIGTTKPENAEKNISYASKGALPEETVEKLRAAFRTADAGGTWQGLT